MKPIKVEFEDLGPHDGMGNPHPEGSYTAFRVVDEGDAFDERQMAVFMCPSHQIKREGQSDG